MKMCKTKLNLSGSLESYQVKNRTDIDIELTPHTLARDHHYVDIKINGWYGNPAGFGGMLLPKLNQLLGSLFLLSLLRFPFFLQIILFYETTHVQVIKDHYLDKSDG